MNQGPISVVDTADRLSLPVIFSAGDGIFSTQTLEGDILLEDAGGVRDSTVLVNASQVLNVRTAPQLF